MNRHHNLCSSSAKQTTPASCATHKCSNIHIMIFLKFKIPLHTGRLFSQAKIPQILKSKHLKEEDIQIYIYKCLKAIKRAEMSVVYKKLSLQFGGKYIIHYVLEFTYQCTGHWTSSRDLRREKMVLHKRFYT